MRVLQVRRFPVKSCGGEALPTARVDRRGLIEDRGWAVIDGDGKLASGKNTRRFRRHDEVFALDSRLVGPVPEVRFPGQPWMRVDAPTADATLSAHMSSPMRFAPERAVSHMDAGQVSLIGTASLAAMAELAGIHELDPRRLRVNLVIETDQPWLEESWLGREITIGDAIVAPVMRAERCRMVDIAQDGVPLQPGLLKAISLAREMKLAVYADVRRPGTVSVGDPVVPGPQPATDAQGHERSD